MSEQLFNALMQELSATEEALVRSLLGKAKKAYKEKLAIYAAIVAQRNERNQLNAALN